ncbi:hypothetical protein HXA34_20095 [Salipaludibacillus agaradhaerens]|jgi:nitrogen fixation-related uncharacterized protein|uniref:hypothetical protein n=1 Tax=Salipaludibacillus agaradhaerens TaxID=76935 RepID=UPI002150B699|nr:hypothetical protein [Salipaludibacillus agaradhaerens]MCR6108593.1 hypothetical protein [Salipaludibacillus agaradhaerens]MCR6120622.1 hypothetical protein [Salipaludibacillus agaradhaerens]
MYDSRLIPVLLLLFALGVIMKALHLMGKENKEKAQSLYLFSLIPISIAVIYVATFIK